MDIRKREDTRIEAGITRQDFLQVAWKSVLGLSALLGLGGLLKFLSFSPDPAPKTEFDLGPAKDFPPGSQTISNQAGAVVLHTKTGLLAFSLTCPHLGCRIQPQPDGYACPCHGSRFALNGKLLHGPAERGLDQMEVTINAEGHLLLRLKQS